MMGAFRKLEQAILGLAGRVRRCLNLKLGRLPTTGREPLYPGFGAPGGIRTHNPWVRSPVLYPLSYRRNLWGSSFLGRATGFEPVISCATDRRLGPLGYARRTAIDWSLGLGPSYGSKKVDLLQERQPSGDFGINASEQRSFKLSIWAWRYIGLAVGIKLE